MGFLNDWISGCANPPKGLNLITAIAFFLAHLFHALFAMMLTIVLGALKLTILNHAGSTTVMQDVQIGNTSLAAIALAMLTAFVVWRVLTGGADVTVRGRWEGWQGLMGNAVVSLLWIGGSATAVQLLLHLNNRIVAGIDHTLTLSSQAFAVSCSNPGALGGLIAGSGTGVALGTLAAGAGLAYLVLLGQGLLLFLILAAIYVIGQWLFRLAEIVFWGSLLPLAAATIVLEPSRNTFHYVWKQVQGAIFTQSAMAFGLYLVFNVMLAGHTAGNAGTNLLDLLMAIAGLFMVGKIPQYFQQLHGHSTDGGFSLAKGAGAIMLAHGAEEALAATPASQLGQRFAQSMASTAERQLSSPTLHNPLTRPLWRTASNQWHKMGINIDRTRGLRQFDQARYETASGSFALQQAAQTTRQNYAKAWHEDRNNDFKPPTSAGISNATPDVAPYDVSDASPGYATSDLITEDLTDSVQPDGVPSTSGAAASFAPKTAAISASAAPTSPPMSPEDFVKKRSADLQNYLRNYVQPMTFAKHAQNPTQQMAALTTLNQKYQVLGTGGPEAVQTFAELVGVKPEDLARPDVQARITQDLAVKQWAGNLQYADAETINQRSPLNNTTVRGLDPDHLALTFGGAPRHVVQYLNRLSEATQTNIEMSGLSR
ncbi:hypothetical protein SAMN00768000_3729 [Sulfobacillus thermosulfidooxidans DSM 9293]|uniref:Uncharacterized protein n=1 Tax=Sulfobacillus thermosulfidooxidans (strain DSM 9293 / VKM B-1269 / AT-1) TaxID=929705 RepID=A0A1W1WQA1_SULTA|nr:hypothetical protein [Sulfobacillus thermosulfidooxidans]SMC08190.1 hypothetical protein SAMN00768000_3729 [Sulfobacillus thermosulfidooxidans DSM 9293]